MENPQHLAIVLAIMQTCYLAAQSLSLNADSQVEALHRQENTAVAPDGAASSGECAPPEPLFPPTLPPDLPAKPDIPPPDPAEKLPIPVNLDVKPSLSWRAKAYSVFAGKAVRPKHWRIYPAGYEETIAAILEAFSKSGIAPETVNSAAGHIAARLPESACIEGRCLSISPGSANGLRNLEGIPRLILAVKETSPGNCTIALLVEPNENRVKQDFLERLLNTIQDVLVQRGML